MELLRSPIFLALVSCLLYSVAAGDANATQSATNQTRIIFGEETFQRVTTHIIYHIEPDLFLEPGSFLFAWGSALYTTRSGWKIYLVTGSIDSVGYKEGTAVEARFDTITSFLQLNRTTVILLDRENSCLRLLDREKATVTHFSGSCQSPGYIDGSRDRAQFRYPYGMSLDERDNENLIIPDFGNSAIRSVSLKTGELKTIIKEDILEQPAYSAFDVQDKNILYVTATFLLFKVYLKEQKITQLAGITGRGLRTDILVDGLFASAILGYLPAEIIALDENHLAIADFWRHEVRVLDLQNNQLTSICQPRRNDSLILGVGCNLTNPHALLLHNGTLFVGDSGSIHMIQVSSLDDATFATRKCSPHNIDATIADGEDKAKVEIEKGKVLLLSTGNHKYVYMKDGLKCTVFIAVTAGKDICPVSINKVASLDTQTAVIDLDVGASALQFELPIGKYVYKMAIGYVRCSININVIDANLERRVQFVVDYMYDCSALSNDVTKNLIESMAENNFVYILELCKGVCTKEAGSKPVLRCEKDMLSVFYSTNLVYGGDVLSIPQDDKEELTSRLITKGTMMSIVDISKIPPVIFPSVSADGSYARLRLSTSCLNKTVYDVDSDTCV